MSASTSWIGWAAGSFSSTYNLILSPQNGKDVPLMTQCFVGKFQSSTATARRDVKIIDDSRSLAIEANTEAKSHESSQEFAEDKGLWEFVPGRRRRRKAVAVGLRLVAL